MRSYWSCLLVVIVAGCGGGGSGGNTGGNDVLQSYVSEFSYPKSTTVISAWDSQTYVLNPVVKYLKANSELVFSQLVSAVGLSVSPISGNVTFNADYAGGCSSVQLKWPKTGESLLSEVCLDKEALDLSWSLSKAGGNSMISENGEWVFAISKANPASINVDLFLTYFDRAKNETIMGGGIFPNGSSATCSAVDSNLPVGVNVNVMGATTTRISNQLVIDWAAIPLGEYQFNLQCTVSVGQEFAKKTAKQKVKVIN